MRVIVCGGRDYTDYETVRAHLAVWMLPSAEFGPLRFSLRHASDLGAISIVHGAARGADTLAAKAAQELGYAVEPHPADWNTHGRAAGPIRNKQMLDLGADLVLAFPGGRGTAHMVSIARKAGVPVKQVTA